MLLRCDAIPEPTFLWWDARLQPRFGTLEVRIMDSQTRVEDTAAIAALVQCLVRMEAEADPAEPTAADAPEVLSENRFIAARDGMEATLIEPATCARRPVRDRLAELVDACGPYARALDCEAELAYVERLAASPGAARQREMAEQADDLEGLLASLGDEFI